MALCDAHAGMAENIERLRDGQERLFQLTTKTAVDISDMSGHVTQLFELTAQNEERRKETDGRLDVILDKLNRLGRKPSMAKMIAIIVPAILGSGGVATLIAVIQARGGK